MADVVDDVPFTNAATAISQGKRHLLVRDYTAAVTAFAEGLEFLSKIHGDCGDELGEPYLLYGRALLGLAREEAGVLGGGVPGSEDVDDADEAEDDAEDEDGDDDKLSNIDEKEADEDENVHDINKTDDKKIEEQNSDENEVGKSMENVNESAAGSSKEKIITNGTSKNEEKNNDDGDDNNIPSGSGGDGENDEGEDVNKEDDEDDPGRNADLQVAWEVLELAKIVFFKRGKSGLKNLAEAYRLLGEVAMESGNHQCAVSDLEQALKILENVEPYESRSIAELHYQLGLAHSLLNDFDASIEQFNEATNLLEARIKELEQTKEPPKTEDPFYTIEGEIKELKELLPEIQEKIVDMKDFKQEACRLVIEGIKSKVAGSCTNGAGPSTAPTTSTSSIVDDAVSPKQNKPASDISHLVRKKRKADDVQLETPSPCKKTP